MLDDCCGPSMSRSRTCPDPTYFVSSLADSHVKVVLSGDGETSCSRLRPLCRGPSPRHLGRLADLGLGGGYAS